MPRASVRPAGPPPLMAGDRLTRAEFERRYEAHPEIKKAELIEGVVHVPSPTRFEKHGRPHSDVITWLGLYCAMTPGVRSGTNVTIRLDFENEVQPDALLRLDSALGGRSRITDDDYLAGPPELIVEIAASSASYDLHNKRRVYQRSGVQEYLALQVYEQEATWFALCEGVYEPLLSDASGILRSEVFPGLWLNVPAFWAGDPASLREAQGSGQGLAAVLATLQQGLASPEHVAFVAHLHSQP
ncbi:MAG: Uma2 family endonuclease [Chloroflexi bacterium]|nr:Uma2 family endonuclease [Chloroflexota bacterium]